jgi:hypothetical protein
MHAWWGKGIVLLLHVLQLLPGNCAKGQKKECMGVWLHLNSPGLRYGALLLLVVSPLPQLGVRCLRFCLLVYSAAAERRLQQHHC